MSNGVKKPGAGAQKPVSEQHAAKKIADSIESGTLFKSGGSGGADAQVGVGIAGFFGALNIFSYKETSDEMQDANLDPGTPAVETPVDSVDAVDLGNSRSTEGPKITLHQEEIDTREASSVTPLSLEQYAVAGNGSVSGSTSSVSLDIHLEPIGASREMQGAFSSGQAAPAEQQVASQTGGTNTDSEENENQTSEETNDTEPTEDGDALNPSELSDLSGPVTVTYTGDAEGTITDGTNTISFSDVDDLTLTDFADVVDATVDSLGVDIDAGAGSDTIAGSTGDDVFAGGDGNDSIDGALGDDSVMGGAGNDELDGGAGQDTLEGGAGDDVLSGGDGNDGLLGGDGSDRLQGGEDNDSIDGGIGTDTAIWSGDLSDFAISYDNGTDTFTVVDQNAADGDEGTDTVTNIDFFEFNGVTYTADQIEAYADGSAPTGISFVSGGAVNETVVDGGTIDSAYDPSGSTVGTLQSADTSGIGDTHSYMLINDPSGKFEVVGNEIRVKSGQVIDYETDTSFDVTVRTTDINGQSHDEVLTINVTDYEGSHTAGNGGETINGTSEEDAITGGTANDTISGGLGEDTIDGGDGGDSLEGGAGDDTLRGEDGNDTLVGGAGDDFIDGAAGVDVAVFSGDWTDYTITEDGGTYTVIDNRAGSSDGTDTVTDVENFRFADGDVALADVLNATPTDITPSVTSVPENTAAGTVVATLSTTDVNANDTFSYAITSDLSGFFEIVGDEVRVASGASLDFETATSHDVTIEVTDASGATYTEVVTFTVTDTAEHLTLANGGVSFTDASVTEHSVTGGFGNDTINGSAGNDNINGGSGDDSISSGDGADYVHGWFHDDYLDGGGGNDTLLGDASNDTLVGGAGDDSLHGGNNNDRIEGGSGNDNINGGNDTDMAVYAGDLSDFTVTWDGSNFTIMDQVVVDGLDEGTDTVTNVENFTFNGVTYTTAELQAYADGSAPTDISFASGGSINETVVDGGSIGSANDPSGTTVATLATTDASAGDTHSYTLVSDVSGSFEIVGNEVRVKSGRVIDYETDTSFDLTIRTTDINGQTHDEILTLNVNDFAGSYTSGNGGETITGTSEEDEITGGTGNDWILGGAGPDSITGGDGSDTISGGTGDDSLAGGADEDTFIVEDAFGNDTINGGSDGIDDDVIDLTALTSPVTVTYATAESGTITNGADTISFSDIERFEYGTAGTYIDKRSLTDGTDLEGGSGNDTIYGTSGEDLLVGGAGDDVIYGYEDNDTIDGGEGSDLIYLSDRDFGGSNLITDSGTTGTDTVVFELDIGGARTFRIQSEFSSADGIEVIDGSTVTGESLGTNEFHADFDFTGITLIDVDEIAGTDNNDTIIGSAGGDSIDGNNGDDYLSGAGGNDTIEGDSGDDTLLGGAGDDVLEGDDGNDVFYIAAMQGDDTVDGGSAGGWTDTIQLDGMVAGAVNVAGSTVDGDGWTLVLDGGHSVNSLNSGVLELSSDASGVVTFDDGGTISFADVERVTW